MLRKVTSIANRQRLDVVVNGPKDANRLLIYTGIAVLDEQTAYAIKNSLVHQDVDIILGTNSLNPNIGDNFSGSPFTPIQAVCCVSLAAINDMENSDSVTWAVDEAKVEGIIIDPTTTFLKISTRIAFQGEFTSILRLSYHADVLAILRE